MQLIITSRPEYYVQSFYMWKDIHKMLVRYSAEAIILSLRIMWMLKHNWLKSMVKHEFSSMSTREVYFDNLHHAEWTETCPIAILNNWETCK